MPALQPMITFWAIVLLGQQPSTYAWDTLYPPTDLPPLYAMSHIFHIFYFDMLPGGISCFAYDVPHNATQNAATADTSKAKGLWGHLLCSTPPCFCQKKKIIATLELAVALKGLALMGNDAIWATSLGYGGYTMKMTGLYPLSQFLLYKAVVDILC